MPDPALLARADDDPIFVSVFVDHKLANTVALVALELQKQLSPVAALFFAIASRNNSLRLLLQRQKHWSALCGHHFQQTEHQPVLVTSPACDQLNRGK